MKKELTKELEQTLKDDKVRKIYDTFVETNVSITENFKTKKSTSTLSKYDVDKTLFIYSRVSTDEQLSGTSLDEQISSGKSLSEKLGFDYKLYNEGSKSSNHEEIHKREKLLELYNLIGKKKVKHLYVSDISRLSRTTPISMMFQIQMYKNKVKFYTRKGEFDFENEQDKLLFGILNLFSQYDNEIRRTRSILGKIYRLRENKFVGGLINFGYKVVDRKIVVDEEESKYVKKMFQMYDNYKSTKEIQDYLIRNNVKTRRQNSIFSTESIMNILKNEIYIGRRRTVIDNQVIHTRNKSIVSVDIFYRVRNRVHQILERRNQNNKTSNFYLLRHLLYCKKCGNILCGRMIKRNGVISENFYYCSQSNYRYKRTKKSESQKRCDLKKSVNIQQTDKLVWNVVCDVFENSHLLREEMKRDSMNQKLDNSKSLSNKIRTLRNRLTKVDSLITQLQENSYKVENDFYSCKITKERMMSIQSDILKEIEKQETISNGIKTEIEMLSSDKTWIDWLKKYQDKTDTLRKLTDKKKQKKHLDEFIERIDVDYDDVSKEHTLDITLKLKLFNDKLIYKDVNNKKSGYEIEDGSKTKSISFKRERDVKKKRTI